MIYFFTDNEIDGLALLELTVDDLSKLLPDKLGIVKKIYRLVQAVSYVASYTVADLYVHSLMKQKVDTAIYAHEMEGNYFRVDCR